MCSFGRTHFYVFFFFARFWYCSVGFWEGVTVVSPLLLPISICRPEAEAKLSKNTELNKSQFRPKWSLLRHPKLKLAYWRNWRTGLKTTCALLCDRQRVSSSSPSGDRVHLTFRRGQYDTFYWNKILRNDVIQYPNVIEHKHCISIFHEMYKSWGIHERLERNDIVYIRPLARCLNVFEM